MLKGGEALFRRGLHTVATATKRVFESHQAQYLRRAGEQAGKMETLFELLKASGVETAQPMETGFSTTYAVDRINPVINRNNPLNTFFALGDKPVNIELAIEPVHDAKICAIRFTEMVGGQKVAVKVKYDSKLVPTPDKPYLDPLEIEIDTSYPPSNIPEKVSAALRPFKYAGVDDQRFTESDDKLKLAEELIKIAEKLIKPKDEQVEFTDAQMAEYYLRYPGAMSPLF